MKLLIVEDEKKTGEYLTKGLTEAGFVVDLADNGLNGYHLAMTGDYDLIILDIMLPDVNGWDIQIGLVASGIKNGDLNFGYKIPHPAAGVK